MTVFKAFIGAALAALFISGCGGGGSTAPVKDVSFTPREGLHMAYFQDCGPMMMEHVDHIDTWWTRGDCGTSTWAVNVAQELKAARGTNIKHIVLSLPTNIDAIALRSELAYLAEQGSLRGWDSITLYPMDEPETLAGGSLSDLQVRDHVTAVKQVALDVGLANAHYGVLFQCASGQSPGIKAFDRVGCYRYGSDGCPSLESDYARLRSGLAPGALLIMVPGGATVGNEGRQEPACWASYAHRNSDVWGIAAFLYQSVPGILPLIGIRDNGLLHLYCETGRVILKPSEAPHC